MDYLRLMCMHLISTIACTFDNYYILFYNNNYPILLREKKKVAYRHNYYT